MGEATADHGVRRSGPGEVNLIARAQGHWYLVGNCRTREAIRWFRLDRVTSAHLTTEPSASFTVEAVGTRPRPLEPSQTFDGERQ